MHSLSKSNNRAKLPLVLGLVTALALGACSSNMGSNSNVSSASPSSAQQANSNSSYKNIYRYRDKYSSIFRGKSSLPPLEFSEKDKKYNAYPSINGNPDPTQSDVTYQKENINPRLFNYQLTPALNLKYLEDLDYDYAYSPIYGREDRVSMPNGNYIENSTLESFYKRLGKNARNIVVYQMNVERLENLCWVNSYLFNAKTRFFTIDQGSAQYHMLNLYNQPRIFDEIGLSDKIIESAYIRTFVSKLGDMSDKAAPMAIRINDFRGMRVTGVYGNSYILSTPNRQFVFEVSTAEGNNPEDVDLTKPVEFFLKKTYISGFGTDNVTCHMSGVFNQKVKDKYIDF